ncbi:Calcium/calmodulin-dependent protein kinase type 1 [Podila epigama]|nr:Calcium/calmodulin-dependent protein kinase type 1 [Podila epigama]
MTIATTTNLELESLTHSPVQTQTQMQVDSPAQTQTHTQTQTMITQTNSGGKSESDRVTAATAMLVTTDQVPIVPQPEPGHSDSTSSTTPSIPPMRPRTRPPPLEHFIYTVNRARDSKKSKGMMSHAEQGQQPLSGSLPLSSHPPSRSDSAHSESSSFEYDGSQSSSAAAQQTTMVLQTLITEPETPSPILPAWPAAQLNPDYLAPYHPKQHKNLRNWSQGLLHQLCQKSETPPPQDSPSSVFQAAFVSALTVPRTGNEQDEKGTAAVVVTAPTPSRWTTTTTVKDISASAFPLPPSTHHPHNHPHNHNHRKQHNTVPPSSSPQPLSHPLSSLPSHPFSNQHPPVISPMVTTTTSSSLGTSTSASTVPSVVTPPGPVLYPQSEGDRIERHFLFQTHHRPLRGQTKKSQQQEQEQAQASSLATTQPSRPRRKSSAAARSAGATATSREETASKKNVSKTLPPSTTRTQTRTRRFLSAERFRRLVRLVQRLLQRFRRQGVRQTPPPPVAQHLDHQAIALETSTQAATITEALPMHERQQQQQQQQQQQLSQLVQVVVEGQQEQQALASSQPSKLDFLQVDEDDDTDRDHDNGLDGIDTNIHQSDGQVEQMVCLSTTMHQEDEVHGAKSLATLASLSSEDKHPPPRSQRRLMDKLKEVPKMIKIVDRMRQHTHTSRSDKANDKEEEMKKANEATNVEMNSKDISPLPVKNVEKGGKDKEQMRDAALTRTEETNMPPPVTIATATSTAPTTPSPDKSSKSWPRYHPKLLDLYIVTDRVLGVGTFATVKEIKLKTTGQSFALKIILKRTIQGKASMLDTEIAVLSKVRHANCVSLLEMFETEDAVFLVTDLAAGGELFDQLLQKGYYTEADAARLVHEILLGVEYLHSLEIVHRDLKPENLLFADKSENARLMITDFGLSKVLTGQNDVLMTACGTPGYVAPEVLEQVGHGKPVDLWSIGVIAYTLLCGFTPFWGEDQAALFENIISGEYQFEEDYWKDISGLAKSFIDSLLIRPAERRPTATQALAHPWFRAMLDQDLVAPASPTESVNLLPSVRKNFNATNVFKKAVRAVNMLRKLQASEGKEAAGPSTSPTTARTGAGAVTVAVATGGVPAPLELGPDPGPGAGPVTTTVTFHDIVSAALLSKRALANGRDCPMQTLESCDFDSEGVHVGGEHDSDGDVDENLEKVNAILEGLTAKEP